MTPAEPTIRPEFSRAVALDQIEDGSERSIEATEAERAAIAAWLGLEGLSALTAAFTFSRGGGALGVRLRLNAVADRICVASLEPMVEHIDETVEMRFERDFSAEDVNEDEAVIREPWPGETVDLGTLAADFLALSLAPHPRKDGAASLGETFGGQSLSSPFAALGALVDAKTKPAS